MSKKELLIAEIEQVPEPFLDEVLDFVHFLKLKIVREGMENAVASESSLKKDWLKPEEDQAWQNLGKGEGDVGREKGTLLLTLHNP